MNPRDFLRRIFTVLTVETLAKAEECSAGITELCYEFRYLESLLSYVS